VQFVALPEQILDSGEQAISVNDGSYFTILMSCALIQLLMYIFDT
jgi:hypothetical protein